MDSRIPSLDLHAHHEPIKAELYEAIRRVVDSNAYIMGPDVAAFEADLAEYCQVPHAIGVSSGSDALIIALMALDIQPGDEIITTPFSFFATVGAIVRLGATPVFVDIDPNTFNLDVSQVADKITPRTKGLIPVHLYGQCADLGPLVTLAQEHNLFIVEDAAQSVGAEYNQQRAGSVGTIGCFSFFPAKNLGAFGDAGGVTTACPELAERMRVLRVHGSKPKYYHSLVGGNFRLDTIQAAVLRVKLQYLDAWIANRQRIAATYDQLLSDAGLTGTQVQPPARTQHRHVFNQYVLRVDRRDELQAALQAEGISTAVYYPRPLHLQQCFANLGHQAGDFPAAERAAECTLAIPIYPELEADQQQRVVSAMTAFYAAETGHRKQPAA